MAEYKDVRFGGLELLMVREKEIIKNVHERLDNLDDDDRNKLLDKLYEKVKLTVHGKATLREIFWEVYKKI